MNQSDDDRDPPGTHQPDREADKLAATIARMDEEKRARYDQRIENFIDRHGEAGDAFRLSVATSIARGQSAREEARSINDHERRESQRLYDKDIREEHQRKHGQPQPTANTPEPKHQPGSPSAAPAAKDQPRDYAELQRTHAKVDSLLSEVQLKGTLAHFDELRRANNITQGVNENNERTALARAHQRTGDDVTKMQAHDREHIGYQPMAADFKQGHAQERNLVTHQQLAETVSLEAKWMDLHLRQVNPAEAQKCAGEQRHAAQLSRDLANERGALRDGMDYRLEAAQRQQQQSQSNVQEAARGGRTLTDAERANAPADAKAAIDRKENAKPDREPFKLSKEELAQHREQKSERGPSPPAGRGR